MSAVMQTKSGHTALLSGVHHHLVFYNGFRVYGWTPNTIIRSEAIKSLIDIANGDEQIYFKSDVDKYCTTKK